MKAEAESLRARFKEYLSLKGLSFTPQRSIILEHLIKDSSHFNAEDLISVFRRKKIPVSRATVYRTISHLVDAGFLLPVALESSQAYYEFAPDSAHHEHLVCEKCGRIIEFTDPMLENRIESIASLHGFKISRHAVQISGTCRRCCGRQKT
ncbi:MAG TPA: transcriptional repressor [Chitinispirillaceae bacterium]|jgi:Fur family ferric uptake transcriptional regulator|nr:transcriptional repressor [Chitinispirillaceae bacterium]